ncbi:S-layer homology domain-containing protein [Sporosarcina sp. CAU 1771]
MKKIKCISGSLVLLLTLSISSIAHGFSDVPDTHGFKENIDHLVDIGALNGYPDGTFNPNGNVTRGQAAKIITVAFDMPLVNPAQPTFTDIPKTHPYYQQIETLVANKILNGYANGTFGAANPVIRSHMAKILSNSLNLTKESDVQFSDVPKSNEFYPYINRLATAGITTGRPDGTFGSSANVNRGQMAAFVSRGVTNIEAGNDDRYYYRYIYFGMGRAQVKAAEVGTPTVDGPLHVVYENMDHGEFPATIEYFFTNDKLDMMSIDFDVSHVQFNESEDLFKRLVEDIYEPQFFSPSTFVDKWEDHNGNELLEAHWDVQDNIFAGLQMSTGYGRGSINLNFSIHEY